MISRKGKGNCYSHVDTLRVNSEATRISPNVTALYRERRAMRYWHSPEGKRHLEKREADTAKCFVCGKTALYRDGTKQTGLLGACAQHRDQLPNKYKSCAT